MSEQANELQQLYTEKQMRIANHLDYHDIDEQIDQIAPPIVLYRRNEKFILLSDGTLQHPIFEGGMFEFNQQEYTIQAIRNDCQQIKVNGQWHDKSKFEPAKVTLIKDKKYRKGKHR